jgi:hypothetical protein
MPSVNEIQETQLASGLHQGVETLSLTQEVTFTRFQRLILPLDGFVFWVKADLIAPAAMLGHLVFGQTTIGKAPAVTAAAAVQQVKGSFHYATDLEQREDRYVAVNQVIFTAEEEIQFLNEVAPDELWIAEYSGLKFAFSGRGSRYLQADLFHYHGHAVYSTMLNQLIDKLDGLDLSPVVSNSLPLWLALGQVAPIYPAEVLVPATATYPSFLSPLNLIPPYVTVHVDETTTRARQAAPVIDNNLSHYQLATETVRLTLWGFRGNEALDFQDYVLQYSLDTDDFGISNMPVMRDLKETQPELGFIGMKKSFEIEINYYQARVNDIARQTVTQCIPGITLPGYPGS